MDFSNFLLVFLFLYCSCKHPKSVNNADDRDSRDNITTKKQSGTIQPANGLFLLDSLRLDSILYFGKKRLTEVNKGRFSFDIKYNRNSEIISISSKSRIERKEIKYEIFLKTKGEIKVDDFHFYDEDNYDYVSSEIKINLYNLDLTNVYFANDSNARVYPAGLWHGSIGESALKYYKYNNIEYFLLNGVNLFCNGTHCTSYQIYLLTLQGKVFKANALYCRGDSHYQFDDIHLIDIDEDGYPEIYVAKNNIETVKELGDFEIYTFDNTGTLKRR